MAEAAGSPLLLHRDGVVATLTLNRPAVRNAIDDELRERLLAQLVDLHTDGEVSTVVITGAGSAFCAGGDVAGMRRRLAEPADEIAFNGWQRQQRTAAFIAALHNLNQITIAAVNGPAVGLGLDLALACDFVIAAPTATFASSFVRRGLIPDGGGLYFLPRRIGLQATKDLVFTGRRLDAREALELSLVDRIADAGDAVAAATAYARTITQNPRSALMLTKSILNQTFESSLETVARQGGSAQAISYTTAGHRAAVDEYLRK